MRVLPLLPAALVAMTSLLAGCTATDPLHRQGLWEPSMTNQANLEAMVAVPSDLVRGVPDDHLASGQTATSAVDRQRNDIAYPLPASGVTRVTPTGNTGGPAGGASPGGTAGNGGS